MDKETIDKLVLNGKHDVLRERRIERLRIRIVAEATEIHEAEIVAEDAKTAALMVIVMTPHIRQTLRAIDPKALDQAMDALNMDAADRLALMDEDRNMLTKAAG